jgi:hypothetical protein
MLWPVKQSSSRKRGDVAVQEKTNKGKKSQYRSGPLTDN